MDSFELNKMIGAFLGVLFVVFSVSIVSDAVFSPNIPSQQGYAIEAPEEEAAEAPAEAGVDIVALLPDADPARGQAAFRRCEACHTVDEGGANRIGPNLWDIVGRPVATHEGFSFSAAMREYSQGGTVTWEFENLGHFLRAPRSYIPGTAMAFAGIRDPQEEADLLVYLRELSDDPVPLPEPTAATDDAEDATEDDAAAEDPAVSEDAQDDAAEEPATDATGEEPAAIDEQPAAEDEEPAATEEPEATTTEDVLEEVPTEEATPDIQDDGTSASPQTGAGTEVPVETEEDE